MQKVSSFARAITLMSLVALTGCGRGDAPELAAVTGKVTLDGSPLIGAEVGFFPKSGRPAFATTNDKGEYTLQYLEGMPGAPVGENSVQIRRSAASGEGIDPKKQPAELSEQYNDKTTLAATRQTGPEHVQFRAADNGPQGRQEGSHPGRPTLEARRYVCLREGLSFQISPRVEYGAVPAAP